MTVELGTLSGIIVVEGQDSKASEVGVEGKTVQGQSNDESKKPYLRDRVRFGEGTGTKNRSATTQPANKKRGEVRNEIEISWGRKVQGGGR